MNISGLNILVSIVYCKKYNMKNYQAIAWDNFFTILSDVFMKINYNFEIIINFGQKLAEHGQV